MNTLLVECIPGDDGGLRQHFNLEVYVGVSSSLNSFKKSNNEAMHIAGPTINKNMIGDQKLSGPIMQRLHSNHNSTQPNFIVSSLTPGTPYTLVLYAINAKGRSQSVSLSAVTLAAPEKHTARGK